MERLLAACALKELAILQVTAQMTDDAEGVFHAEERLLLWAVAGLRGVVIGGRPGSRSTPQPRAVLWGEHSGSLIGNAQVYLSLLASRSLLL